MSNIEEVYLTEKQLADMTNTGIQTWRNRRSKGVPPTYLKIGRSVRYRMSDLKAYLEERTIELENRK